MTIPGYCYTLPLQNYMLMLAAIDIRRYGRCTEEELQERMKLGRAELSHHLGVDFGYDLTAWHNYLLADPELASEYTFNDTEEHRLCDDVLAACTDQRRTQLVAMLLND